MTRIFYMLYLTRIQGKKKKNQWPLGWSLLRDALPPRFKPCLGMYIICPILVIKSQMWMSSPSFIGSNPFSVVRVVIHLYPLPDNGSCNPKDATLLYDIKLSKMLNASVLFIIFKVKQHNHKPDHCM